MEDLRGFNTPDLQVDNSTAKLLAGAMIVTLAVGAGAAYALLDPECGHNLHRKASP